MFLPFKYLEIQTVLGSQYEFTHKGEVLPSIERDQFISSQDGRHNGFFFKKRELLSDAISRTGRKRNVRVWMATLDVFRKKPVRVEFVWVWKVVTVAVQHVRHYHGCSSCRNGVVTCNAKFI